MGEGTQTMRKIHIKNCEQCGKVFYKTSVFESARRFYLKRFCSLSCTYLSPSWRENQSKSHKGRIPWNKGRVGLQVAWNKGNGEYAKKLGFGKWMLGKKQGDETRRKKSEAAKKIIREGRHNLYIDGRDSMNHRIRNSLEYKLWRESVFERDNWTCQECGKRGVTLNADHIKPFAYFPELRFELSNGRTLCVPCHKNTDTYMGRALKYNFLT